MTTKETAPQAILHSGFILFILSSSVLFDSLSGNVLLAKAVKYRHLLLYLTLATGEIPDAPPGLSDGRAN